MNSIQRIAVLGARGITSSASTSSKLTPELAKIRARQEFFQMADGKLIHEKTAGDRFMFYLTSAGVTIAMGMTLKFYYDFAFPKKA